MQVKRSKFLPDGRFGKNLGHQIKLSSRGQNTKIRVSFKRDLRDLPCQYIWFLRFQTWPRFWKWKWPKIAKKTFFSISPLNSSKFAKYSAKILSQTIAKIKIFLRPNKGDLSNRYSGFCINSAWKCMLTKSQTCGNCKIYYGLKAKSQNSTHSNSALKMRRVGSRLTDTLEGVKGAALWNFRNSDAVFD